MFEPLHNLFRGDEDKMERALRILERVTREDLASLTAAYQRGDGAQVAALAHKLKSSCMQVGHHQAAEILFQLEVEALTHGNVSELHPVFQRAQRALEALLAEVWAWFAHRAITS